MLFLQRIFWQMQEVQIMLLRYTYQVWTRVSGFQNCFAIRLTADLQHPKREPNLNTSTTLSHSQPSLTFWTPKQEKLQRKWNERKTKTKGIHQGSRCVWPQCCCTAEIIELIHLKLSYQILLKKPNWSKKDLQTNK